MTELEIGNEAAARHHTVMGRMCHLRERKSENEAAAERAVICPLLLLSPHSDAVFISTLCMSVEQGLSRSRSTPLSLLFQGSDVPRLDTTNTATYLRK